MILEAAIFISSIAALVAAIILCRQHHGWTRIAWALAVIAWAWVVLGELVLNLTGSSTLIFRWMRGVPARALMAIAFWILVWRGRKERRR